MNKPVDMMGNPFQVGNLVVWAAGNKSRTPNMHIGKVLDVHSEMATETIWNWHTNQHRVSQFEKHTVRCEIVNSTSRAVGSKVTLDNNKQERTVIIQ